MNKLFQLSQQDIAALYFALVLFGQIFVSSMANFLHIENRTAMIAFRLLIMALSCYYVYLNLRWKKFSYFSYSWLISLLTFWLLYVSRLLFDVRIIGVKLAIPSWELLAWGLGSSLLTAICSYLFAAQNNLNFILHKPIKYGVYLLGISIICFLFNPGLKQGAFYLNHLNAITCANAGCALILLCFARFLLGKLDQGDFDAFLSMIWLWLGFIIGLFIVVFSATRGVLLATVLIIGVSIFSFRSFMRVSFLVSIRSFWFFASTLTFLILTGSFSSLLLEKLFTSRAPETIITRLELWRLSIEQFFNSPLFGLGFRLHEILGNLEIEKGLYYPHNYLFESLAVGGIIMTFPLLYCILFPVINFHKYIKLEASALPICFLASQVLIYSMHNGHLGDFPFFWMMIGMMAGTKYRLEGQVHQESDFFVLTK